MEANIAITPENDPREWVRYDLWGYKGDGRRFECGFIHVQAWSRNRDGSFTRLSDDARMMSNEEIKRYGPLIRKFCKNVKFR